MPSDAGSPMIATSFDGPTYRSSAQSAWPNPVGAPAIASRISRSADTPACSYPASPVNSASRSNTSAATEFPDGVALSYSSFGRSTRSSASEPVWKKPPRSSSRNSRISSSASVTASSNHRTSNVVSYSVRHADAMTA